jgi:hypothetical protein
MFPVFFMYLTHKFGFFQHPNTRFVGNEALYFFFNFHSMNFILIPRLMP